MYFGFMYIIGILVIFVAIIAYVIYRTTRTDDKSNETSHISGSGPELIAKYKELLDQGVITEEEFEKKKRDILEGRDQGDSFVERIDDLAEDNSMNALWFILGFFIQLAGLLLFILWRKTHPRAAKYALVGAIVPLAGFLLMFVGSFAI